MENILYFQLNENENILVSHFFCQSQMDPQRHPGDAFGNESIIVRMCSFTRPPAQWRRTHVRIESSQHVNKIQKADVCENVQKYTRIKSPENREFVCFLTAATLDVGVIQG